MTLATRSGRLLVVAAAATVLIALACSGTEEQEPDRLVFMAGFKPQANLPFVAAYVAQDKGFFSEQNLDVEIQHATMGGSLKFVSTGDVDVTTADAGSLLKRISEPGLPVTAFALFGQRGQQAFIALKDSGIDTPNDWAGKVFGYKGSPPPDYLAILEANGVDRSTIEEIRVGFDPRVLTDGDIDILAVFKSNEPNQVRNLGFEVNLWDPADYGVPAIGLTYVARRDMVEGEPDRIQRFLKATMRGLEYALDNREEALDIVMKFAPNQNREHQGFMLETEMAFAISALTEQNGLGWMTDAQWKALYDHLVKFKAIPQPFDYRTAYNNQFLKEIYDGNRLRWP